MSKCLVVVDMQNDFISGTLGFKKANDIVDGVSNLIEIYHKNNDQVIYTLDTHDSEYLNTIEGKNLNIVHCIKNTSGHELNDKIKKLLNEKDIIFEKNQFGSEKLFEYFQKNFYDDIYFVGLVSNICVLVNVILAKTASIKSNIYVYNNLTASFDDNMHKNTIEILKSIHINIINYIKTP